MNRVRQALLTGVVAGCSLLVAAGPAAAARGGGGGSVPTTCLITLPGIGSATGEGQITVLPSGAQGLTCNGQLDAGSTAPSRAVTLSGDGCLTVVSPSGHVVAHCKPR